MCHLKYFMDNCKEGVRKRCLNCLAKKGVILEEEIEKYNKASYNDYIVD